jgi:hypothetical protein
VVKGKAAGSTPIHASRNLPIGYFGFGKASVKSHPFVSNLLLISMESCKKPKQTPPKIVSFVM